MKKLIDWSTFRENLLNEVRDYINFEGIYNNGVCLDRINIIVNIIQKGDLQPVVDYQKKGVWERDVVSCGIVKYICPHCKYNTIQPFDNVFTFKYCPKCGSKNEVKE